MRRRDRQAPSVAAGLIREARHKNGFTQAQLAAQANVSQQTISRIERGDSDPGIRQLNNILQPIGLTLKIQLVAQKPPEVGDVEIDLREAAALAEAEAHLLIR